MNARGAKLNNFEAFKDSIKQNKKEITSLKKFNIELLDETNKYKVLETTKILFKKLDLVGKSWNKKKIKSKIVSFSKTLHFLLPELIVPIDRKYTLSFFYNNTNIPTDSNDQKNNEKQIELFNELYDKFQQLAIKYPLKQFIDNKWNTNIPKIIDNMIIGYSKL